MQIRTFFLVFLAVMTAVPAFAAPKVVASIKPVHSLVAAVMTGAGVPVLLLSGGASPHSYSLKPSDAAHLNAAEAVIWVGPGFENFLEKPLMSLASKARTVALSETPGLTLLPARRGGAWEIHAHEAGADIDMHVWLNPANAKRMVATITKTLVDIDPSNAALYSTNASNLATRLDALDEQIARTVAPVQTRPFVVFHDAYQYFQAHYRVNAIGSVIVSPERLSGARRIAAMRKKIADTGAACIFAEPDFEPKLIGTLTEGTQAKAGVLDPEGTALPPGPELYFTLMQNIADTLVTCLTP